jgi:hypothetical protein
MTTMTLAAPAVAPLQSLPTSTYDLVILARRSLTEAYIATDPAERYVAAHLCALRAAAAVVAARTGPDHRRRQVRSVWTVLPTVAPELTEWSQFFALSAKKRSAAEAGVQCVSDRQANDLLRDADAFLVRIVSILGIA